MSEWRTYHISDLGRVVTGKTPPSSQPQLFDGTIPFITPSDMSFDCRHISTERFVSADWDSKRRTLLPEGAVCVVCIGATIGKICMSSKPSQTNQQVNSVIVDQTRFNQGFVYYGLRTKAGELVARAAGAATPIINKTAFSEIEINAPSLATQRRIASILGAYDDLIEVNRRRIAVLEEMARGLFESFVTKVIGELPPASGGFRNAVLPDGWCISDLGDIAEIIMGQSPRSEELNKDGNGFPFHQGVTDFGPLFPRRRIFCVPSNKKKVAAPGDILFSVRAPVGRINLATEEVVLGRGVSSFRSAIGTQHYLAAHLRSTFYEPDLIGNGAIYKAVGRNDIQRIPIVLPSAEIRADLDVKITSMYDLLWTIEQANSALAASRDLLLPRLISGQLSVAEAERQLDKVA